MVLLGYATLVLMGLSLGMIGAGGSILTVPILVYLFGYSPVLASAYSLFLVGLTALVGMGQAAWERQVDWVRGVVFAIPSFLGVYWARAYWVPALPDQIFSVGSFVLTKNGLTMLVFSVLMIAASFSMIRGSSPTGQGEGSQTPGAWDFIRSPKMLIVALEGLIVGGVTGFVGAGGGFLIIPALVVLTRMSMKVAIGTSLMIIAVKSLFGFIADVQRQPQIEWGFLGIASLVSVLGMFVGARFKKKISDITLKKAFGWFVLIMGILILGDNLLRAR